jgi:hypothetical protein
MRRQNDISDEAFGLLADLIGGQVLRFAVTESSPRRCVYAVDGQVVDPEVVRELRDIGGQSAIWPSHFDNLDDVPFHVTKHGYAYVRGLADA